MWADFAHLSFPLGFTGDDKDQAAKKIYQSVLVTAMEDKSVYEGFAKLTADARKMVEENPLMKQLGVTKDSTTNYHSGAYYDCIMATALTYNISKTKGIDVIKNSRYVMDQMIQNETVYEGRFFGFAGGKKR